MSIGPLALLVALGLAFWLQKRDGTEYRAQGAGQSTATEASDLDPDLIEALGYVKPDAASQTKAKS